LAIVTPGAIEPLYSGPFGAGMSVSKAVVAFLILLSSVKSAEYAILSLSA
jgi:hypothetical protein